MAKLTKAQAKLHEKAVKLLQCKELSEADTRFVFNHYREDANHINSTAGAFFTPYGLARDFRLHIPLNYKDHVKLIDLCAGIGILSYMAARACDNHNQCSVEITCIEINQDYVDVGNNFCQKQHGSAATPSIRLCSVVLGISTAPSQIRHSGASTLHTVGITAAVSLSIWSLRLLLQLPTQVFLSSPR